MVEVETPRVPASIDSPDLVHLAVPDERGRVARAVAGPPDRRAGHARRTPERVVEPERGEVPARVRDRPARRRGVRDQVPSELPDDGPTLVEPEPHFRDTIQSVVCEGRALADRVDNCR